jgi:hypothetical protein
MKDWDSRNTVERDFDMIKGLGCTVVRILIGFRATHEDADRAFLIDVVRLARRRGFVVEISVSYTSVADNLNTVVDGKRGWLTWLADRWKDDPYVWIQPMNEPNGSPPGDRSKLGDWAFWQREQQQYVAAIRAAGNTAPIIIHTPMWSWDLRGVETHPLDDPLHNLIFAVHRYANENQTFTDAERAACDRNWADLAARLPIIVDEVGGQNPPTPMHLDWNRGFLDYCADWVTHRDGNGVVAFNWYWCDDNSLTGDWRQHRNTGELTDWGIAFRDHYLSRVKP